MAQSIHSSGARRVTRRTQPNPTGMSQREKRPPVAEKTSGGGVHKTNTKHKSSSANKRYAKTDSTAQVRAKSAPVKRRRLASSGELDYTLLFLIILVVTMGLIVLLSASAPSGSSKYGDSYYYFKRQLVFVIIGFVGMMIVSKINLNSLLPWIPWAFLVCLILLGLVLIPGIGVEANGARRWLNIPFIQLQPSELMKPVIAMFIAYMVKLKMIDLKTLKGNMICAACIGLVAFLLMCETHLSGTLVIVGIAICVMYAGGTPIKPILIGAAVMLAVVIVYLQFDTVRMERITSFMDPFADAQDSGYQISQSLYAIGSGRLFGLGLGQSVQKYSHLPEPYNDFIFAIVCEELGFFGGVVVILLFAALFLRSMRIAINAPDVWSSLTCVGIAAQLGIQTFLNMGVAVSLIPNTGVSLPFFSSGGTSVMTLLLEMGILLNVSRKSIK